MQDQGAQKFWESLNLRSAAREAPTQQHERVLVPFFGTETPPDAGGYVCPLP